MIKKFVKFVDKKKKKTKKNVFYLINSLSFIWYIEIFFVILQMKIRYNKKTTYNNKHLQQPTGGNSNSAHNL